MVGRSSAFSSPTNFKPFQQFLLRPEKSDSTDWAGFLAGLQSGSAGSQMIRGVNRGPAAPFAATSSQEANTEEPGLLNRFLASLDAPQNAVMNTVEAFTTDDPNKSGWDEFGSDLLKSGKAMAGSAYQFSPLNMLPHKIPGTQALDELAAKANPANSVSQQLARSDWFKTHNWQREALGFAGDILTDPLTYIPVVGWGAKAAKITSNAVLRRVAPETINIAEKLAKVEARSNLEQVEDIVGKAAAGETPIVKPHPALQQTFKEAMDPANPEHVMQVIRQRPLYSHIEEAAQRATTGRGAKDLAQTESSALASEALAKKMKTEQRFLSDASKEKFGKPTQEEVDHAVDTANISSKIFTPIPLEHVPNAGNTAQANTFSTFLGRAKKSELTPKGNVSNPRAWSRAVKEQIASEDHMLSQNTLKDGSNSLDFTFHGEPIRLSDVLAKLPTPKSADDWKGVDKLITDFGKGELTATSHPALRAVVQEHQATKAVMHPEFVQSLLKHVSKDTIKAKNKQGLFKNEPLSSQQTHKIIVNASRKAAHDSHLKMPETRALGKSAAMKESNAIGSVVGRHLDDTPRTEMEKLYVKGMEASYKNKVAQEVVDAGTHAVEAGLGKGSIKDMVVGPTAANVPATIMGRMGYALTENLTTWSRLYGMQGFFKNAIQHAVESARWRNMRARQLTKGYSDEDIKEAYKVVQGKIGKEGATKEAGMAAVHFDDWFSHLLGETSSSSIGRLGEQQKLGILMKHINKDLNRVWGKDTGPFRLRADKFKDADGRVWDFTPGGADGGWTNSWKAWPESQLKRHRINNPVHMMHDLDLAMERQARMYSTLQDAGERWGRKTQSDEFVTKIDHEALDGYYFPKEVKDGLDAIIKHYDEGSWVPTSKWGRHYSKALRAWKSGATVYSPSHHERNFMGDLWLTWMAGHSNIYDFYRGARVMKAFRQNYRAAVKEGESGFEEVGRFTDPRLNADPSSIIIGKKGKMKQDVTASDLYHGAYNRGLLPSVNDVEDIGVDGLEQVFNPKNMPITRGRVRQFAMGVSEHREHTVRLHHFTAAVNKRVKKGMKLDDAMDEAAAEVRKWHPDGTDLTRFEQKYMRNIIPFYSWQRKAIPLIIEGLITSPAKIMAPPRGMLAISAALGLQEQNPANDLLDPFPDNNSYTDWLRAAGTGPVGVIGGTGLSGMLGNLGQPGVTSTGDQFGTTIIDPVTSIIPFNQTFSEFGGLGKLSDPKHGALQSLNPLAAGIIEQMTGHDIVTNAPNPSAKEYIASQIPPVATAARLFPEMFGGAFASSKYKKIQESGVNRNEALINWLTAMGLTGSGQYKSRTDIEARNRAAK